MPSALKNNLQALLIGQGHGLCWTLPQLLARAGFEVDVISRSYILKGAKFVRHCDVVAAHQSFQEVIAQKNIAVYDWIIPTTDQMLSEILNFDSSIQDKLRLLPVLAETNFSHLYSKIGLSETLSKHAILTPEFAVAKNNEEALSHAKKMGYPILLKQDASNGGNGVFACEKPDDFLQIASLVFNRPVLIQKKIEGQEFDISALFLEGNLIHFNYAKIEKTCKKFGPSWLRTYSPVHNVDSTVFDELSAIGKALGAHGFTNISCIEAKNGRFYIEVDMRANVWVEFPRFFGDDPAPKIQKWFSHQEILQPPATKCGPEFRQICIPYFLRMRRRDILLNRYGVWKYIPFDDKKLTFYLLIKYFLFSWSGIKSRLIRFIKFCFPFRFYQRLKQINNRLKEFFIRQKWHFWADFF